jgi:hypothetical protein
MLVGRRPLNDPDINKVPAKVRGLIRSCLEEDPKKRLRQVGDAVRVIERQEAETPEAAPRFRWLWPGVAATAVLGAVPLSFLHWGLKPAVDSRPVSFQVVPAGILRPRAPR